MRYRDLLSAYIFLLIIISCKGSGSRFSLEIREYGGAAGITIYYMVTNKSVQVDYNCELKNCRRETVYKRDLDKRQSDSIYYFIQALHMDSLRAEYKPKGFVEDGLVTYITLHEFGLPTKSVMLDNRNTPTTDALLKFIVGLVPERFRHF
jgi:hypothetical protein